VMHVVGENTSDGSRCGGNRSDQRTNE
jgi:hypothetical protein